MTAASIANPNSKTPPLHPQRGASVQNSIWWMVSILLLAAVFRFLSIDSAHPVGATTADPVQHDRRIANGWHPLFISEAGDMSQSIIICMRNDSLVWR
jgi:hypothetical protein